MKRALVLVAACGGHADVARSVAPSTNPPAAPSATPLPPTYAVVDGTWTLDQLGGPVTVPAGIGVDGDRVELVYASVDHDPVMATASGNGWTSQTIDATDMTAVGTFAPPAMLFDEMDSMATAVSLEYIRDGQRETIASGCELSDHGELLAADVVTYTCKGGGRIVARRGAAGWETIATLPDVLAHGAVDATGAAVLLDINLAAPVQVWTIANGRTTESAVPGVESAWDVASCGGRVYATFESDHGAQLGWLDDGVWTLETISAENGLGTLGFDEQCHPFVASYRDVWSRGRAGWVKASVPLDADEIRGLVGHGGVLYASYQVVTDSIHAGVATTRLKAD